VSSEVFMKKNQIIRMNKRFCDYCQQSIPSHHTSRHESSTLHINNQRVRALGQSVDECPGALGNQCKLCDLPVKRNWKQHCTVAAHQELEKVFCRSREKRAREAPCAHAGNHQRWKCLLCYRQLANAGGSAASAHEWSPRTNT